MRPGPTPELLTSRRDRPAATRWHVEPGPAVRGEAWTDMLGCVMRVPFDAGAHGRLVRAHELMHARVSPAVRGALEAWPTLDARTVECAEEFRVNHLLQRIGFDLAELRDGSERLSGTRLAEAGDWGEAVRFAAALAGTRAARDLLRGVRGVDERWAATCRSLERDLVARARRTPLASLASTRPAANGLPEGFAVHTRELAELIAAAVASSPLGSPPARRRTACPAATGVFAPLLFDATVPLDRAVPGALAQRRRVAAYGRRVVRPDRLLTDPGRRMFERPARSTGGIVVVDQSGSMAMPAADLERLLAAAPGAYVLAYSHAPGSSGVPNAWVLADRGRAASVVRPGNVGNGVDGPALRHALSRRRRGEPVVWVCDGQVTDSGDHADAQLAAQCARLVVRHGIAMVASIDEALELLCHPRAPGRRPRALGRVGAAVTGVA